MVLKKKGSFLGDFLRLSPVEAALELEVSESEEYLRWASACGPLDETVVALQLVLFVLLVEGVLIVVLEVHLVEKEDDDKSCAATAGSTVDGCSEPDATTDIPPLEWYYDTFTNRREQVNYSC